MLSFCMKYTKDESMSEEIVEECMVYLWERRKDLEEVRDLKAYLYTMVKNMALRSIKQRDKVVSLDAQKYDQLSESEEFSLEEDVHSVLLNALETLPEKCKIVFKLSCIEGLKYKDIAEDLNISVNTVKSQRARALELLKSRLNNYSFLVIYILFLLKRLFF
ncbi:RNA polymerase sigma-70 factor [Joostella atrarenae]|uniref:RNA polymerase sigma-70 factor n=1 Tax=Joostella atrarenae TaxID=679257 RepID=A0ABS9J576_9FLAO|nr:RNA polymerase sigma-70 factor [Joostella atrarenae]